MLNTHPLSLDKAVSELLALRKPRPAGRNVLFGTCSLNIIRDTKWPSMTTYRVYCLSGELPCFDDLISLCANLTPPERSRHGGNVVAMSDFHLVSVYNS